MGTKTVRLDEETENSLAQIQAMTGLSVSDALKKGLNTLHRELLKKASGKPWDIYQTLNLGDGGYAHGSARNAKKNVRDAIKRKHAS